MEGDMSIRAISQTIKYFLLDHSQYVFAMNYVKSVF